MRMARDASNASALTMYLGTQAFAEYRRVAASLDESHLSVTHATNLIFIPGVMGSLLQSRTKGGVWWIDARTWRHINDLRLSADGANDADARNAVVPFSTDPSYEPFLSAVLDRDDFGHEVFAYDWRKPLAASAAALRDLVRNTYQANGNEPVHLVTHSMGGLMARAALLAHGDELWPMIGRIVFLGTPHYGSPAIAGYLKNHLWGFDLLCFLGAILSRQTFRSMRGVLSLLPAPRGVYPGTREDDALSWRSPNPGDSYIHPCASFDLYDAAAWELDLTDAERAQLQTVLTDTADFHRRLYEGHKTLSQELRDRMLVIAGVGQTTLFRMASESRFLGLWQRVAKTTSRIPGDPHRDGDGRVPVASAALENVEIRYVKGVHGGLPNIPVVYEDVFRWLNGKPPQLPDSTAGALSMHLGAETEDSQTPHLDGSVAAAGDGSGLWRAETIPAEEIERLRMQLEAGQLPEFTRIRMF
jgi:pimeloyl-ACP methyl ester carboxylesterase